MTSTAAPPAPKRPGRLRSWTGLAFALAPALLAIWLPNWVVTQDGPAHLYNAHILNASVRGDPSFRDAFEVRFRPLPNWAGHALAMACDAVLPPREAERALTTITLLLVSAATFQLRLTTRGEGDATAAAFAALLGLNLTWMLGFTSFLLGTAAFAFTLGYWWGTRDRRGLGSTAILAGLLVLGYFCHPLSLGPTLFALFCLASFGSADRRSAFLKLAAAAFPLVPFAAYYLAATRQGGGMEPVWEKLRNPLSLADWKDHLGWVDPITFAGKTFRPFGHAASAWNAPFGPSLWFGIGLVLLYVGGRGEGSTSLRGWRRLAALLIGVGILSPDTLGESHGHYLPQRIVVLGLIALMPSLPANGGGPIRKSGRVAILVALALQTAWVWDYALECSARASEFVAAKPLIGTGRRVGTVLIEERNRFRVDPLLHFDCLFGVDTGNVIWSNYETGHYYFPVRLRDPERSPRARDFEAVAKMVAPEQKRARADLWRSILDRSGRSIDVVVLHGHDPELESINASRFARETQTSDGNVRIWSEPRPYEGRDEELHLFRSGTPPRRR